MIVAFPERRGPREKALDSRRGRPRSQAIRTVVLGILFCSIVSAQTPKGLALTIATAQMDSPIQILAAESSTKYTFDSVKVLNRSEKPLASVTFAISIGRGDRVGETIVLSAWPRVARLKPGETSVLDGVGIASAEIIEARRRAGFEAPVVTLGVVRVDFEDLSVWIFDLESQRRFPAPAAQPGRP